MLLLSQVATGDTAHFGEVFEHTASGFQNRVAMPHVWEGALFYLAAMALTDPDAFHRDRKQFPLPGEPAGEGCACGGTDAQSCSFLLLLLVFSLLHWKRNEIL